MRFSERTGHVPPRNAIQIGDIDEPLKNKLWNVVRDRIVACGFISSGFGGRIPAEETVSFLRSLWHYHFKERTETIPDTEQNIFSVLRDYFFTSQWYIVYDLVEFIVHYFKDTTFKGRLNHILEAEMAGYRVVDWEVTPITDENEIAAIEATLANQGLQPGPKDHLTAALRMLSDRQSPDFRNSIKESISAVAGTCKHLTQSDTDELGKTLNVLERDHGLHGALKSAFRSIYGYTSNADGIRHSMMDSPSIGFGDAYFFFLVCSAFINYLLEKLG